MQLPDHLLSETVVAAILEEIRRQTPDLQAAVAFPKPSLVEQKRDEHKLGSTQRVLLYLEKFC